MKCTSLKIMLAASILVLVITAACSSEEKEEHRLGRPCDLSSECGSGEHCDDQDNPTIGMCTVLCNSSDYCEGLFGPESFCIGSHRCVMRCAKDEDCAADQLCGEGGWCRRRSCESDAHCWRYGCNPATRTCRTMCTNDSHCQLGYSCAEEYDIYECLSDW